MVARDAPVLGGYAVAPMQPRHLPEVAELERTVYTRGWSERIFAAELDQRSDRHYLVALKPALLGRFRPRVVGYAGVMWVVDEAHITTVVVHPDERRQGIARALVEGLLDATRERGIDAATLEVRTGNSAARELYRGFGFAPVGVRERYYEDTGEDALIMWRHGLLDDAEAPWTRPENGGSP